MSDDIVARLRKYSMLPFKGHGDMAYRIAIAKEFLWQDTPQPLTQAKVRATLCDLDDVLHPMAKTMFDAANDIERLRAELRTYTGDGHNTKGEPCTPNTPS